MACSKWVNIHVEVDWIHTLLSSFPQEKKLLPYARFTGAKPGPPYQSADLQAFIFASGVLSQSFHLPCVQTSCSFIFFSLRTSLSQFLALPERLCILQASQNHSYPSIGIKTLPSYPRRIFQDLLLVLQFAHAFQMKRLGIEWVCTELASSCPDPQERFDTSSCFYKQFIIHR